MIKGFIILLQFMTRIPVPVKVEYDEEKLGKAIKFFPLVGLIIGLFLFAVNFLAGKVIENRQITAVIIIMAEILITGLCHRHCSLKARHSPCSEKKYIPAACRLYNFWCYCCCKNLIVQYIQNWRFQYFSLNQRCCNCKNRFVWKNNFSFPYSPDWTRKLHIGHIFYKIFIIW